MSTPRPPHSALSRRSPRAVSTTLLETLEPRALLFAWTSEEVYLTELVNRARQDPMAEQARLNATRTGDDPVTDLTDGLTSGELARLVPQEPLALNQYLTIAARAHSLDMANRDFFDHVNPDGADPTDRAEAAGYTGSAGENIAAGYRSLDSVHRAWINSLGHRRNVFSLHSNFTDTFHYDEFGPGFAFTDIGPFFDYHSQEFGVQESPVTRYLVGVVFGDANGNFFYNVGEGAAGIRIDVARASDSTVVGTYTTDAAGNYQIPVGSGSYIVTFTRLSTGKVFAQPVTVSTVNVKRDARLDQIVQTPGSPDVPTDDHPNAGSFLTADAMAITPSSGDGVAQGFISPASDTDLFKFVPVATGGLNIRAVSITAGMDIYIRLFGSAGNPLEISFDDGADPTNAELEFNVVAGQTYYIQLELQSGTSATGQYVLTVDGRPIGQDDDGSGGSGGGGGGGGGSGGGGGGSNPDNPDGGGEEPDERERYRIDRDSSDAFLSGSVDRTGAITLTTLNQLGRPVLLRQRSGDDWSGQDFLAVAGGPDISGQPLTWTDPKDNRSYAAARSRTALVLYTQATDGSWSIRNLTVELPGSLRIDASPTVFIGTDGLVRIAGLTEDGQIVLYSQTGAVDASGNYAWTFANLTSNDLEPQGLETPRFTGELISYVTAWNGLNIAGLDENGDIRVVWWAPGLAQWQTSNLSDITGAPSLAGGLTAYLTSWQGINIAGVDENGRLRVTWWVPEFDGNWQNNDLTEQFGGPVLSGGTVASYVTSWGGLNVVGLDEDGKLVAYWWAPEIEGGRWQVSNLSDTVANPPTLAGKLTGVPFGDGISVVGFDDDGDVLRYHWSAGGEWQAEDVTGLIVT